MSEAIKSLEGQDTLHAEDLEDFSRAEKKILALMQDWQWHSASQIIAQSQQREGLRRLRSLRRRGFALDSRRANGSREFEYRLRKSTTTTPRRKTIKDWQARVEELEAENADLRRQIASLTEELGIFAPPRGVGEVLQLSPRMTRRR